MLNARVRLDNATLEGLLEVAEEYLAAHAEQLHRSYYAPASKRVEPRNVELEIERIGKWRRRARIIIQTRRRIGE